MGQSMQKPSRSHIRNHSSRLSARSLQRSSNISTALEKRGSFSTSKIREGTEEENNDTPLTPENTQIRNGELFIMSKHEEHPPTIKQGNQLKIQRGSIGGQCSLLSPNFRQIAETGAQYGLGPWGAANVSKQSIEVSRGDAHNDITISFSKAKNVNNNPFHEDHEDRRSSLMQILEYDQESQQGKSIEPTINTPSVANYKYQSTKIDKNSATRPIYSEKSNKPPSPQNIPKELGTPKKGRNYAQPFTPQLKLTPKTQKKSVKNEQMSLQNNFENTIQLNDTNALDHSTYNDYDCADFKRKIKEQQETGKKPIKMSKKMQELKQKIASKATTSKDKESILKGSIQRLSKSLRRNRDGNSLEARSRQQSKGKLKPVLSKVQCLDIKIDSHTELKPDSKVTRKLEPMVRTNKSPKQSYIQTSPKMKDANIYHEAYQTKIRSNQQLGKTTNPSSNSNSRLMKNSKETSNNHCPSNASNTYVNQNLIIQSEKHMNQLKSSTKKLENVRDKEPSFTEMIKKQHFGNKQKKKGEWMVQESLKYSQVQKGKQSPVNPHFFASTCQGNKFISGQQYEFFDVREPKKPKQDQTKLNKHQINSLKLITEQLTGKTRKSKIKVTLHEQSNNSQSQEPSVRNKTYQQRSASFDRHPGNMTALNYTELIGNHEEYMLRDALNRQREGQQWAKQQKKRHKSSEHSSKMTNGVKSRLLVF